MSRRYVGVVLVTQYAADDKSVKDADTMEAVRVSGSEDVVKRAIVEALSSSINLDGVLYSVAIKRQS